jgi:hypothetical protein
MEMSYLFQKNKEPTSDLPRGWTIKQYYAQTFKEAYKPRRKCVYKKKKRIRVFLSHPNGDELVMNKIHDFSDFLRKKSKMFTPWCDKDYLGKAGRDLNQKLVGGMIQALEESDIVIVGLPMGRVSNWIIAENRQAKTLRKRILIVNFGKSKIKPGMVRSRDSGYVRITGKIKQWENKILEALEEIMKHGIHYEEF